jgi:hypothetical protein
MDEQLLAGKLFIFRKLYKNGVFEKRKLQAILIFLKTYVRFKNPETNSTFSEEVDKITVKKNAMDIFEQVAEMQRQELVHETKRLFVENLIKETKFSMNKIASLAKVSLSFVKKVKKEVESK